MTILTSTIIQTKFGKFKVCYHEFKKEFCLSFSKGNILRNKPIVRIHSACLFGEVFQSLNCDCYPQLKKAINLIDKNKNGVIIYSFKEGRGLGIKNKIKAMELERLEKIDCVESYKRLGFKKSDNRNYKIEIKALNELKINKKINFLSGNPKKIEALKKAGYIVKKIINQNPSNLTELAKKGRNAKIRKLGYKY